MTQAEPAEYTSTPPAYYTAKRVHRILVAWEEFIALAETPQSAYSLIRPGPTLIEPRIGHTKGAPSDPFRFADIIADIERAHSQLSSGGLGVSAVKAAMTGVRPSAYSSHCHIRKADVLAHYRATVAKMARILDPGASSTE